MFKRICPLLFRAMLTASLLIASSSLLKAEQSPVAQQLNFREYSTFEGLPQAQTLALAQDANGFIWTGSYAGISRYNGYEFTNYTSRNGLPNNTIRALMVGHNGELVIGTAHGLCFFANEHMECVSQGANLISSAVFQITKGQNESYWIGTEGGVTHLGAERSIHYTAANGLPDASVREIALDASARVWVGSDGLFRLKGDQFMAISPKTLSRKQVRTILHTGDGTYVGTTQGLHLIRGDEDVVIPELPEELSQLSIIDLFMDSQKNLWIGHYGGVHRLVNNQFERLTPQPGLDAVATYKIMEDREQNLWFATDRGVSKLVPSPFVSYTTAQGMSHAFVRAMAIDDKKNIWMGTRDGISFLDYANNRIHDLRKTYPLPNSRAYAVLALSSTEVLIGTQDGLIWLKDGKIFKTITTNDGLSSNYVSALKQDKLGNIWIGSSRGLAVLRNGQVQQIPSPEIPISGIYTIHIDSKDRLWLGTGNIGIRIFDTKSQSWVETSHIEAISNDTVWTIDSDAQDNVWIGTNGNGLVKIDEELNLITRYDAENGLKNDYVWQVLVDSSERVWAYTNTGLVRIEGPHFRYFDGRDGLVDLEGTATAILEHPNGEMWFGTGKGVMRYIPERELNSNETAPILIEKVSVDNRAILPDSSVSFEASDYHFNFASLSFANERETRFRYRILGLSERWSPPQAQPMVLIPKLSPGKYTFEVAASNNRNGWSIVPAKFSFSVSTPFWRSYWFITLAAILAFFTLFWLIQYRVRNLTYERAKLEKIVEERTLQLRISNAELNRLALTDHLTQLYNRRHLMESLSQEIKRLTRTSGENCLSFILMDIDHFKKINDSHGHSVGDEVLIEVARRLYECARSTDLLARFGGEEFALVLPMTDETGASIVAEKIRFAMASESMLTSNKVRVSFTMSLGVNTICNKPGTIVCLDPEQIIKDADFALYQAKSEGRNCWSVFKPNTVTE